jgi:glycosyltransferase involved in cell wall biosynthesis
MRSSSPRNGGGKINVLFVHSQDGFGADSAVHAHIMRYLDRDRFSVHVACPSGNGSSPSPSLVRFREIRDVRLRPMHFAPGFRHRTRREIVSQLRSTLAFPVDLAALGRYIVRERIHVVHGTDRPRDALYAVGLGRLTGVPSIVHVHVAWSNGYSAPAKWGVRNATAIFAISRFVTETVVATGTPRSRVSTILNGIDVVRWNPDIDGSGIREEFRVPLDAPLLASVSRLFGQKGQRELLRALARVRESVPNVHLLIVGADAVEVHGGSFTAELRSLAQELGVADRVVFTGPRTDIPQIMAACDVFTLPSFEEPFGLVYLEAMAMRRPVVAVDDGGTPEVVEHGRSGLLSPYGDIERLAANIVTLLRDGEMRRRMGAYGRSRVVDYFNAQRMARDASAAYEAVVKS